jgi:hypothetical protein
MTKLGRLVRYLINGGINPFIVFSWEKTHRLYSGNLKQWAEHYHHRRQVRDISLVALFFFLLGGIVCLYLRFHLRLEPSEGDFLSALSKVSALLIFFSGVALSFSWTSPHPMLLDFRDSLDKLEEVLGLSLEQLSGATPKILNQYYGHAARSFWEDWESLRLETEHLCPELRPVELDKKWEAYNDLRDFLSSFGFQEGQVATT